MAGSEARGAHCLIFMQSLQNKLEPFSAVKVDRDNGLSPSRWFCVKGPLCWKERLPESVLVKRLFVHGNFETQTVHTL